MTVPLLQIQISRLVFEPQSFFVSEVPLQSPSLQRHLPTERLFHFGVERDLPAVLTKTQEAKAKLLLYLVQEEIGSGLILADLEQARWCRRMLFSLASKQQSALALAVK